LQLTGGAIRIHETLDNFGKIIINESAIINEDGNITNHYGGVVIIKSGSIINNSTFSNEGTIINGVGEEGINIVNNEVGIFSNKVTAIINMDEAIFSNKATGIIFNGNGAYYINTGILINNNIIFNDRSFLKNFHEDLQKFYVLGYNLGGTNFTYAKPLIFNNATGIIFNKPGSIIHNLWGANFTNGDEGLIFFDAGAIINNFSPIKNSNKIFSDCGAVILDDAPIVEPAIEIPCN